jgi:hypothetical protein
LTLNYRNNLSKAYRKIRGINFTLERKQFIMLSILSLSIFLFAASLYFTDPHTFQIYLGNLNPLLVIVFLYCVSIVVLAYFISQGWYIFNKTKFFAGLRYSIPLTTGMAFVIMVVDLMFPLPQDLNKPLPESLFFYPIMGYIVEVFFHLVPLSLLLLLFSHFFQKISEEKRIWAGIFIVSILEPILQLSFGFANEYPPIVVGYSNGLHVFLINFLQLTCFKRFDFFSMFTFRMIYYFFWHILWGYIRLIILFPH